MKLKVFITNDGLQENGYLYYSEESKNAILIDPGMQNSSIMDFINNQNLNLKYILLTHAHFDHISGIKYLKESNAPVLIHEEDEEILGNATYNGSAAISGVGFTEKADRTFKHDEIIKGFDEDIRVIHTPGHTKGGSCFYLEKAGILFTGDTLFKGAIGRSDFYSGNGKLLCEMIESRILTLPDETVCYTGHGLKTTVLTEKNTNPFF